MITVVENYGWVRVRAKMIKFHSVLKCVLWRISVSSHNGKTGSRFTLLPSITGKWDTTDRTTVSRHWTPDRSDLWSLREGKHARPPQDGPGCLPGGTLQPEGKGGGPKQSSEDWLNGGDSDVSSENLRAEFWWGWNFVEKEFQKYVWEVFPGVLAENGDMHVEDESPQEAKPSLWAASWMAPRVHTGLGIAWFQPKISLGDSVITCAIQ